MSDLGNFEGQPVTSVGLKLGGAGTGLSDALKLDPQQWGRGQRVTVILDGVIDAIDFVPADKDEPGGPAKRVHVFKAETAVITERVGDVAEMLDAHEAAVAEMRDAERRDAERAKGVERLDLDGGSDDGSDDRN